MEIHAPEGHVRSIKDFLVHISIVTLGILIALGLDGLREAFHNRHLVRETRENVHVEMEENGRQAVKECRADAIALSALGALVDSMPQALEKDPDGVRRRVTSVEVPNYFLTSTSWQSALSTGALAHVPTAEVIAYAGAEESIRIYTGLQNSAIEAQERAIAFFLAHPRLTQGEAPEGMERLIAFRRSEEQLAHVCPAVQEDVARALRVSATR